MTYRILVGLLLSTSLVACGPPRPTATPEDLATAAAQAAWRDRVKRYDAQWAKAVSDCYGDQRATEYVARGVARDLQKACEIDATITLGPSPALSSISVEPPAAAPASAKAAEPVTAAIQAVARPTVADVSMINRPGEVSDAYICDSADAVGYDPEAFFRKRLAGSGDRLIERTLDGLAEIVGHGDLLDGNGRGPVE